MVLFPPMHVGGEGNGNPLQCSCLPCPQLSELVRFLLWELSVSFHIFHRHRVCLVYCEDLICSLYSWWESFGYSSLATLSLDFNFHLCIWVVHWGLLLRLSWRTWVCPREDQMWRSRRGLQGPCQYQVLRGARGRDSREYSSLRVFP